MTADLWDNRTEIKSESSDKIYVVARRIATGMYECSCPGWKLRRTCKHLRNMNLPTAGPTQAAPARSPRSRRLTPAAERARREFAESKKHYDPLVEGYGNPSEWAEAAKRLAAGRGALKVPAHSIVGRAEDMAAMGISAMPATADGMLAAWERRAEALNDPITGDPDEFWRAFAAYERLIKHY